MGGYGSGRVDGREPRRTVEDGLSLSIRALVASVSRRGRCADEGTTAWTRVVDEDDAFLDDNADEEAPSIGWRLDLWNRSLNLVYTCQGTAINTQLKLKRERMPRGGWRWAALCPCCGERVVCLYLPWRALTFACRRCYDLTYRGTQRRS